MKRNVQEFADSIIAAIEAKKLKVFDDVERRTKASLQETGQQKEKTEEQAKRHELEIEDSETLLKRTASAQLMQPKELMDEIFKEENNQEDSDCDDGFFQEFYFVKNQKVFDLLRAEQIGSLKDYLTQQEHNHRVLMEKE